MRGQLRSVAQLLVNKPQSCKTEFVHAYAASNAVATWCQLAGCTAHKTLLVCLQKGACQHVSYAQTNYASIQKPDDTAVLDINLHVVGLCWTITEDEQSDPLQPKAAV